MYYLQRIFLTGLVMGLLASCGGADSNSGSEATEEFEFAVNADGTVTESISGEITTSDDEINDFYYDVIDLGNISAEETLTAAVTAEGFDVYVFLVNHRFNPDDQDSEEDILAVFNEVGTGATEEFSIDFSEFGNGDYFLYITTANANEVGAYTLQAGLEFTE